MADYDYLIQWPDPAPTDDVLDADLLWDVPRLLYQPHSFFFHH